MGDLEQYSAEDLQAELERREKAERERAKPKPLDNPDWASVLKECQWYIDECHAHGYEPKDSRHYIYASTIAAIYGPDVWDWINDKVR